MSVFNNLMGVFGFGVNPPTNGARVRSIDYVGETKRVNVSAVWVAVDISAPHSFFPDAVAMACVRGIWPSELCKSRSLWFIHSQTSID